MLRLIKKDPRFFVPDFTEDDIIVAVLQRAGSIAPHTYLAWTVVESNNNNTWRGLELHEDLRPHNWHWRYTNKLGLVSAAWSSWAGSSTIIFYILKKVSDLDDILTDIDNYVSIIPKEVRHAIRNDVWGKVPL